MADKTSLETIQEAAAQELGLTRAGDRGFLNAFLVQAFDAGAKAQRELSAEVARATKSMNELVATLADGYVEGH